MVADNGNNRAGENPFIGGFSRIIVVNGTAGGVAAVNGIPGGAVGGVCHSGIDTPIIQAGKGTGLIDDTCQCVGEAGVGYSV